VRAENQAFYEFMVPLVKGYSTEMSIEVASLGVQVHGGMGFIEETGAAQYMRDSKILTIYEGTTAIQANDFVGRKTARDGGTTAKAIAARIEATEQALAASPNADAQAFAKRLTAARLAFLDAVGFIAGNTKAEPERRVRRLGAVPDAGRQPRRRLAARPRAARRRRQARRRRRRRLHDRQDRHRALLRRPHPQQGPRRPRLDRRRRRGLPRHDFAPLDGWRISTGR
jgi:hypothetical protein